MVPQASNLTMNANSPSSTTSTSSSSGKNTETYTTPQQAPQLPDYSNIFAQPNQNTTQSNITPAAQITPPPKPSTDVGKLPEVQPNVIVATDTNTGANKPRKSSGTPANSDVPAIPSSNPDNFYILYSQLHYNVVM